MKMTVLNSALIVAMAFVSCKRSDSISDQPSPVVKPSPTGGSNSSGGGNGNGGNNGDPGGGGSKTAAASGNVTA